LTDGRPVLVVDDERAVCELVARVLGRAGHEVLIAETGEQGLALLDLHPRVACLVVDKILPGLGGLEVMAEARRRRPGLPVVLITGHPEPFQLGDARPDAVVTKPFTSLPDLVQAVSLAIDAVSPAPRSGLRERVVAVMAEFTPPRRKRG
jgi:CheY-like chemotaxis protein